MVEIFALRLATDTFGNNVGLVTNFGGETVFLPSLWFLVAMIVIVAWLGTVLYSAIFRCWPEFGRLLRCLLALAVTGAGLTVTLWSLMEVVTPRPSHLWWWLVWFVCGFAAAVLPLVLLVEPQQQVKVDCKENQRSLRWCKLLTELNKLGWSTRVTAQK